MTILQKLPAVPARFWINVLLGISTFFVLLIVFRHAARMNKLLLGLLIVLLLTGVAFQWVFERNEPRFFNALHRLDRTLVPQQDRIPPAPSTVSLPSGQGWRQARLNLP